MAADKKISFEIVGKNLTTIKKEMDAISQSVERVQKSGLSLANALKGKDLSSVFGTQKFIKDIANSEKYLKGFDKATKDLIKTWGDSTWKNAQKSLENHLEKVKKAIGHISANVQKSGSMSEKASNDLRDKLIEKSAAEDELRQIKFDASWLGKGANALSDPTSLLKRFPKVAAYGALAMAAAKTGAALNRAAYESLQTERDSEASVGGFLGARRIEAFQGKGYKESFTQNMYGDQIDAYTQQATLQSLLSSGHFGSAYGGGALMGRVGNVAGSLLTGKWGVSSLAESVFTDPTQLRQKVSMQEMETERERVKKEHAKEYYMMEDFMANAESRSTFKRALGEGIYGKSELGTEGIFGKLLGEKKYSPERIERTVANMMQYGARATEDASAALDIQRRQGIEGADVYTANIGAIAGTSGRGTAPKILGEMIGMSVAKHMGADGMKIERESYVQAVMAAVDRVGSGRFMTEGGMAEQANFMAAGLGGMKPTVKDIQAAGSTAEVIGALGADPVAMQAKAAAVLKFMRTLKIGQKSKGFYPQFKSLMETDPDLFNMENRLISGMVRRSGEENPELLEDPNFLTNAADAGGKEVREAPLKMIRLFSGDGGNGLDEAQGRLAALYAKYDKGMETPETERQIAEEKALIASFGGVPLEPGQATERQKFAAVQQLDTYKPQTAEERAKALAEGSKTLAPDKTAAFDLEATAAGGKLAMLLDTMKVLGESYMQKLIRTNEGLIRVLERAEGQRLSYDPGTTGETLQKGAEGVIVDYHADVKRVQEIQLKEEEAKQIDRGEGPHSLIGR